MSKVPKFLKKYFWDVELSKLDKGKHKKFILERILERGDLEAIRWMKENFKPKEIKEVILNSWRLSEKSANYWALIYDLNKGNILCLKESFQKKHKKIWKH